MGVIDVNGIGGSRKDLDVADHLFEQRFHKRSKLFKYTNPDNVMAECLVKLANKVTIVEAKRN